MMLAEVSLTDKAMCDWSSYMIPSVVNVFTRLQSVSSTF